MQATFSGAVIGLVAVHVLDRRRVAEETVACSDMPEGSYRVLDRIGRGQRQGRRLEEQMLTEKGELVWCLCECIATS